MATAPRMPDTPYDPRAIMNSESSSRQLRLPTTNSSAIDYQIRNDHEDDAHHAGTDLSHSSIRQRPVEAGSSQSGAACCEGTTHRNLRRTFRGMHGVRACERRVACGDRRTRTPLLPRRIILWLHVRGKSCRFHERTVRHCPSGERTLMPPRKLDGIRRNCPLLQRTLRRRYLPAFGRRASCTLPVARSPIASAATCASYVWTPESETSFICSLRRPLFLSQRQGNGAGAGSDSLAGLTCSWSVSTWRTNPCPSRRCGWGWLSSPGRYAASTPACSSRSSGQMND